MDRQRIAWNNNALEWHKRVIGRLDLSRQWLLDPTIGRIMHRLRPSSVLDAGCGSGSVARLGFSDSNVDVVGVDFSFEMCQNFSEKGELRPKVVCADVTSLPFRNKSFDLVLASMLFSSVRDLRRAVGEISRVLAHEGILVFSILHPARVSPTRASPYRGSEDFANPSVGPIEKYVEERSIHARLKLGGENLLPSSIEYHHRTLSTYSRALSDAGFVTLSLDEPFPTVDALRRFPHMADFWELAPFLIWTARNG